MLSIRKAMEALPLVTVYIGPPPQPATPRRGHWGHPGNCHEQSLFFTQEGLYALHNFTVLLQLDLEKKFKICKVLALGGPPPGPPWWPHVPYEHLWIPGPWGWFLPSLVKIQPCISSRSRLSYLLHRAPSPTCYPTWGHWGHPGKCHQQPLFFT